MAVNSVRFGPGTFSLGAAPGTDFSCQVQSMGLNVDKTTGDTITVLCGDQLPSSITYGYSLAGTALQDIGTPAGLVEYSWTHKGETVEFSFVPSDTAVTAVTGSLIVDPLAVGTSDGAFGDVMTSDFEFSVVGDPVFTWPVVGATAAAARGAA